MYTPSDDSYLLHDALEDIVKKLLTKNKDIKALDLGSGTGIQTQTLINLNINPKNITLVDINKDAFNYLNKKFPESKVIFSNLFSNVKGKFDLIVFNPPYLPEDKYDKEKDTSGGKKGDETILRFLKQLKNHLNKNGKALFLLSSLTPMNRIKEELKNYDFKIIRQKKLFFEELFVYEIWLKN